VQEPAVSHACNSRFDCPNLRGGLYMVGNTYACSSGFKLGQARAVTREQAPGGM